MKIEPLHSGNLRIWMTDDDCRRWGLWDLRAPETPRVLRRLLEVARQRVPFQTSGRICLEMLPLDGGCLLLVRAQERPFPSALPQVYAMDSADALLQLGEALAAKGGSLPPASLYDLEGQYVLVVFSGETPSLCDWGVLRGTGYAAVAYVEEYGRPITVGDALHRLSAAYESRPPTLSRPVR